MSFGYIDFMLFKYTHVKILFKSAVRNICLKFLRSQDIKMLDFFHRQHLTYSESNSKGKLYMDT